METKNFLHVVKNLNDPILSSRLPNSCKIRLGKCIKELWIPV